MTASNKFYNPPSVWSSCSHQQLKDAIEFGSLKCLFTKDIGHSIMKFAHYSFIIIALLLLLFQ